MKKKKILITGANSYIGTSFEKWLKRYPDRYYVNTIDIENRLWRRYSFFGYDAVFHVAGMVHRKVKKSNEEIYYKVNRDLAYEVANKAKNDGVKQFIFLSSMSVYGMNNGVINNKTQPSPKSNYGKSKLQGESLITSLGSSTFNIVIVRPPMVYGRNCKGNYKRLVNLALKLPIFPNFYNQRSMIYIYNLCEFVKLLIDDCNKGIFCPQNEEYICTRDMVMLIAETHGINIKLTQTFNPIIKLFKVGVINRIFGSLVYEKSLSNYSDVYCIYNLKKSIEETEGIKN
jgi:nucleoside-diphosphate-sugar epimerase